MLSPYQSVMEHYVYAVVNDDASPAVVKTHHTIAYHHAISLDEHGKCKFFVMRRYSYAFVKDDASSPAGVF